jgi:hypothetical protein
MLCKCLLSEKMKKRRKGRREGGRRKEGKKEGKNGGREEGRDGGKEEGIGSERWQLIHHCPGHTICAQEKRHSF